MTHDVVRVHETLNELLVLVFDLLFNEGTERDLHPLNYPFHHQSPYVS